MKLRRLAVTALLLAATAVTVIGCSAARVYSPLPRAVRRGVLRDFPECRDARGFLLDSMRFEVRGCGHDAIYVCPSGTGDRHASCTLERDIITSRSVTSGGGEAPSTGTPTEHEAAPSAYVPERSTVVLDDGAIARSRALSVEVERLVLEGEELSLTGPIGVTAGGVVIAAGGLVLTIYESLRGVQLCIFASCSRTIFPNEGVQIAGVVVASLGAVMAIAGGVWWGVTRHQRGENRSATEAACTAISFGASPSMTGLALRTCFP